MRALSIRQPWTELILEGRKTIEVRSWNTKYRGYFLIHSSKTPDKEAIRLFGFNLKELLLGYILGYVKLSDVIVYSSEEEFMRDRNKHLSIETRYPVYGFILEDPHRIKPIKYKGRLGFFEVSELELNNIYCKVKTPCYPIIKR